jgi:uncharacterized protein YjfI (DUF2170 family)
MSHLSNSSNPLWNQAHSQLTVSMQKEISIMRELLANMHQEELSLLMCDKEALNLVLQERSLMVQRLSVLRSSRIEATQKFKQIALSLQKIVPLSEEGFLPCSEEESCELLSLRDQLMALIERMNVQQARNEILAEQMQHRPDASAYPSSRPLEQAKESRNKKRISIATYDAPK